MIDFRGIGKSNLKAPWSLSLKHMAEDVLQVLDKTGVDKAFLLGHSLGGMVALTAALRFPSRVEGLILVNSSFSGSGHRRITVDALTAMASRAVSQAFLRKRLAKVLIGPDYPENKRLAVIEKWRRIENKENLDVKTVIKQLLAAARFRPRKKLGEISCPTLILAGESDRFVPYKNSHAIRDALPEAQLISFPKGGHELTIDHREEVTQEIFRFMNVRQL